MKNKAFFASDFHLGAPNAQISQQREKRIIEWLNFIQPEAQYLFLLGDVFDFWYEWRHAIPKGFVRFLAKLADMVESGTKIYFFTGNHDLWAYNYLNTEIGVEIITAPKMYEINGVKIFLGHGDGLGNHDKKYKILKRFFTNRILQWMFSNFLHPDFALWLGNKWSLSRNAYNRTPTFHNEQEWLVEYIRGIMEQVNADYYIFGHRHCATQYALNSNVTYINTGVWFKESPYAELSGNKIQLKKFVKQK